MSCGQVEDVTDEDEDEEDEDDDDDFDEDDDEDEKPKRSRAKPRGKATTGKLGLQHWSREALSCMPCNARTAELVS